MSQVSGSPPTTAASHCLVTPHAWNAHAQRPGASNANPAARCSVKFDARLVFTDLVAYLMTSSARNSTDCGIVRPSACAVLTLITSSNFVGCWTGRSAGLAPLRILST